MSVSQACNDYGNESDYGEFEDSNCGLHEDDILFDKYVDSSIEIFFVNVNGNARTNNNIGELITKSCN